MDEQEKQKRREERLQSEAGDANGERRTRLLRFASGAVFLAIAAVVVLIVVNAASNNGAGDADLEQVAAANRLFNGIPQGELILGRRGAPIELREYGDLQCPVCKGYSEDILPPIIENQVRNGEIFLAFRNYVILGQDSVRAGIAALAAGEQGRGWNFIEIFYRNQGKEGSDYVTDEFLEAVAKAARVPNIRLWNEARKTRTADLGGEITTDTGEAKAFGFTGTPSFSIRGPATHGEYKPIGTPESTAELEEAIEDAA